MTEKSLGDFFEEKLRGTNPPEPLEMGVSVPKNIRLPIETIGEMKQAQAQRIKRLKKKIRKYFFY